MAALTDHRGPYVLELAANADERRRGGWADYWAAQLDVSLIGQYAYVNTGKDVIFFFGHDGEGEPKPCKP